MKWEINKSFSYREYNGMIKSFYLVTRLLKKKIKWIGYRDNLMGEIKIYNIETN